LFASAFPPTAGISSHLNAIDLEVVPTTSTAVVRTHAGSGPGVGNLSEAKRRLTAGEVRKEGNEARRSREKRVTVFLFFF
jgi:hypothetical protein